MNLRPTQRVTGDWRKMENDYSLMKPRPARRTTGNRRTKMGPDDLSLKLKPARMTKAGNSRKNKLTEGDYRMRPAQKVDCCNLLHLGLHTLFQVSWWA